MLEIGRKSDSIPCKNKKKKRYHENSVLQTTHLNSLDSVDCPDEQRSTMMRKFTSFALSRLPVQGMLLLGYPYTAKAE